MISPSQQEQGNDSLSCNPDAKLYHPFTPHILTLQWFSPSWFSPCLSHIYCTCVCCSWSPRSFCFSLWLQKCHNDCSELCIAEQLCENTAIVGKVASFCKSNCDCLPHFREKTTGKSTMSSGRFIFIEFIFLSFCFDSFSVFFHLFYSYLFDNIDTYLFVQLTGEQHHGEKEMEYHVITTCGYCFLFDRRIIRAGKQLAYFRMNFVCEQFKHTRYSVFFFDF